MAQKKLTGNRKTGYTGDIHIAPQSEYPSITNKQYDDIVNAERKGQSLPNKWHETYERQIRNERATKRIRKGQAKRLAHSSSRYTAATRKAAAKKSEARKQD
jgi:hypothetical protein